MSELEYLDGDYWPKRYTRLYHREIFPSETRAWVDRITALYGMEKIVVVFTGRQTRITRGRWEPSRRQIILHCSDSRFGWLIHELAHALDGDSRPPSFSRPRWHGTRDFHDAQMILLHDLCGTEGAGCSAEEIERVHKFALGRREGKY